MDPSHGIAPRSPGYEAGALLLSYGGMGEWILRTVLRRGLPVTTRVLS